MNEHSDLQHHRGHSQDTTAIKTQDGCHSPHFPELPLPCPRPISPRGSHERLSSEINLWAPNSLARFPITTIVVVLSSSSRRNQVCHLTFDRQTTVFPAIGSLFKSQLILLSAMSPAPESGVSSQPNLVQDTAKQDEANKPEENVETKTNASMPPHTYRPEIFRMPDYMCWLCRREIEVTKQDHNLNHRPGLCRIISFSENDINPEFPVSISGIGYRLPPSAFPGRLAFVVPRLPDQSVEDANIEKLELKTIMDPVYSQTGRKWNFRVHADCWELVESRADNIQSCALAWCKALAALNWNFAPFRPGMSRYDLPRLLLATNMPCKKNYRKLDMQRLPSYEHLAPELGLTHLPTFREVIPLSRFNLYTPDHKSLLHTDTRRDVFSNLPEEILQHIFRFTRTGDLINFRLASRAVAYVSRLTALPQNFWFSRFLPSFEFSFALPSVVDRDQDWRGLYFLIRKALKSPELSPEPESPLSRLTKRKHWWNRFADVSSVHSDFGPQPTFSGTPFSWPCLPCPSPTEHESEDQWAQVPSSKGCVGAQLTRADGKGRYYSTASMTLPPSSGLSSVGISVIHLCGQAYVSGLRLCCRAGIPSQSLGYVFQNSETFVHLSDGDTFCGFGVRLDADAVRSLRVVLQSPSGEFRQSDWIGDTKCELNPVALNPIVSLQSSTWIRRASDDRPCTFAASFDVSINQVYISTSYTHIYTDWHKTAFQNDCSRNHRDSLIDRRKESSTSRPNHPSTHQTNKAHIHASLPSRQHLWPVNELPLATSYNGPSDGAKCGSQM